MLTAYGSQTFHTQSSSDRLRELQQVATWRVRKRLFVEKYKFYRGWRALSLSCRVADSFLQFANQDESRAEGGGTLRLRPAPLHALRSLSRIVVSYVMPHFGLGWMAPGGWLPTSTPFAVEDGDTASDTSASAKRVRVRLSLSLYLLTEWATTDTLGCWGEEDKNRR